MRQSRIVAIKQEFSGHRLTRHWLWLKRYKSKPQERMNVSRRIHCLRAHRPKPFASTGENVQNLCGCKEWCGSERTTIQTLYTLIVMVILIAIWGVWARKDA